MSGSWGCPHELDGLCQRINGAYCKPGMRGCVLDGKVELSDERFRQPRWPSAGDGDERTPGRADESTERRTPER